MNSTFVLRPGVARKLEFAVQRNDGTAEDLEYLSEGENFKSVALLRTGKAKLVMVSQDTVKQKRVSSIGQSRYLYDADGNIHFKVVSNGRTPKDWIVYFKCKTNYGFEDYAEQILSLATDPETDGVVYNIVVCPSSKIDGRGSCGPNMQEIYNHAETQGWVSPHWEVTFLIRDMFTDEELKEFGFLCIVVMHDSIPDSIGHDCVLMLNRVIDGKSFFADKSFNGQTFDKEAGFAFKETIRF